MGEAKRWDRYLDAFPTTQRTPAHDRDMAHQREKPHQGLRKAQSSLPWCVSVVGDKQDPKHVITSGPNHAVNRGNLYEEAFKLQETRLKAFNIEHKRDVESAATRRQKKQIGQGFSQLTEAGFP